LAQGVGVILLFLSFIPAGRVRSRSCVPAYTFGESAKQKNIGDERRSETDVITGHGAMQTTHRCKQMGVGAPRGPGEMVCRPVVGSLVGSTRTGLRGVEVEIFQMQRTHSWRSELCVYG